MGEVTYSFPFKLPPYKHQFDSWTVSKDREAFALFLDMGCGKSKVLLDTAAHLYLKGEIKGLVLIAPKGVYLNWVDNEIPTHMSDAVKYSLAYWSSSPKAAEREAMETLMSEPGPHLRILCMNCEALTDIKCSAALYLKRFLGKCRGNALIAIDESTTIKNRKAHRTKILVKLGKLAKYRRILSGNPIPNGPMDLFSQVDFLDRSLLGFNDFYAFRNRFAVVQDMKFGQKSFQKVVGYRDTEALKSKMQEFSFIIKKKDCLDLPEKVYQIIDVEMSDEQAKAYNQMVDDAYVELANGATCTALMVMTQYTRLHQIACGFLPTDRGDLEFPGTNHRIEALLEELEVSREYGKVIIWCTYRTNIAQIKKAVEEKFGKESLVEFWGDIKQEERREAKTKFQDPSSKAEFFLSNPATGKFGNTLTKGVTSLYFSNDYNLEHRDQSEDRAHRIGLEKTAIYKDLRVRGTVDDRIIKILKGKKKLSDEIVASNWRWFIGEKV